MSYKFDSLILILKKLDNRERTTVQSLADELEVSKRTVHRYIDTLITAGFPISHDRQRKCYAFDAGYSLARPDLSVEETLALTLAKSLLGNLGNGMAKNLEGIEKKLSVKNAGIPRHVVLKSVKGKPDVEGYLGSIYRAIQDFKRIEITYRALYSGEETARKVDPYYLFFHEDFWHLRGYCHLREEPRTFALDRILSMTVLDKHFIPRGDVSEDELADAFGVVTDREPVEVTLRFDSKIKPYVLRRKWHASQREKELEDGGIELSFKVSGIFEIKQWIYRWLPHVEVVSPRELKEEIRADLKKAIKLI
jgi:predicted DNA-binding transcriptional regulator YafY